MKGNRLAQTRQWSIVQTFRGFSLTTRIAFGMMLAGGLIMGASLWLTDIGIGFTQPQLLTHFDGEWLRRHAYIPNILAGFTGFLIGVPIAAVVLDTVKSDYAREQQK